MNHETPEQHPSSEDLLGHVYDEVDVEMRGTVEAHLRQCQQCQARLGQWRETLGTLDAWKVPVSQTSSRSLRFHLRWGLAALLMLGLGWGLGRGLSPGTMSPSIRAELKAELRRDLAADWQAALATVRLDLTNSLHSRLEQALDESAAYYLTKSGAQTRLMLDELAGTFAALREQDQQATAGLYARLEGRYRLQLTGLRRDLETVALAADVGLRDTQDEVLRLASFALPPKDDGSQSKPQ